MKRKILWCWLSLLLVAALVVASCGPKEEVVEKEGPQYGGTLTVFPESSHGKDPSSWDTWSHWDTNLYRDPFSEYLMVGDLEKGPRGTNEFSFPVVGYIPDEFLTGWLAESWEVTPDRIVFQIRKGIMWTGNANIGMEPRELTAKDVAFSLNRYYGNPVGGPKTLPNVKTMYAEGKYTFVVETDGFHSNWPNFLAYGNFSAIYPPEVVDAGPTDWRNQVGTGPFILKEYVSGSEVVYEKNPNYWAKTTIDGKEYEIPFIDKLVFPIIPDESTRVAAIRTGKLDYYGSAPLKYGVTLGQTSPELIQSKFLTGGCSTISLRSDQEPFNDVDVRRALMVATDIATITKAEYTEADLHGFPVCRVSSAYTPLEKLPASARELYEYNPTKAKQMLADAGYPDGFKIDLYTDVTTYADIASMLVDQWAKANVEANVVPLDRVAWSAIKTTHDYKDAFISGWTVSNAVQVLDLGKTGHTWNFAEWKDADYTEQLWKAGGTIDVHERNAMFKDLATDLLDNALYIPLGVAYRKNYYWPWLKNYYGEADTGDSTRALLWATMWIDQALKTEMGY